MVDSFKTIKKPSQPVLFKDKNSKFYGFVFPFDSENNLKSIISDLKKEHQNAGHFCFAYQIGAEQNAQYKVNDDGEPNNTAGMPIYGQIQSFELTNVLVVVVRYFGGTKLGVSGLINAYRTSAKLALEQCEIIEKTINVRFELQFEYKLMSKVMQLLRKNNADILNQTLTEHCLLEISVRKGNRMKVFQLFKNFYGVDIVEL
jgi:uncharacterized YigZ family protein